MKRFATMIVASIALVAFAGSASAALRSPQVVINTGSLQGYLNSVGESINVLTDQQDIQRWLATVSNNSTFTIQVELAGNAAGNTYGIYNAGLAVPPLYQCFPGAATNGWYCVASFRTAPTRVIVSLFDNNAAFQGSTTYLAGPPDRNDFGFYLQQPPGLGLVFYSQDARNPGSLAQMVTFAGTGINSGSWWLCMEDLDPAQGSDRDFDDAVLFLESINPTPVAKTSWGELKARFK
jgi:hypothetical protein